MFAYRHNLNACDDDAIHARRNAALVGVVLCAQALQLCIVPLLLPANRKWGWLLLIPVLLTYTQWALMHEAIHGLLFHQRVMNRCAGRALAVLFGAAYDLLRWGHLLHHGFNRTPRESTEVLAADERHRIVTMVAYYLRLMGGLYLLEVVGSLLCLLPRRWLQAGAARLASRRNIVEYLVPKLLLPATLHAMRIDVLCMLMLYTAAFLLYGRHAGIFCVALYARAPLVSLMDNVFHYSTPLGDVVYARNLQIPAWTAKAMLHFNLHGVHHALPALPWHRLSHMHAQQGGIYQGRLWSAMAHQLRGPIRHNMLDASSASSRH